MFAARTPYKPRVRSTGRTARIHREPKGFSLFLHRLLRWLTRITIGIFIFATIVIGMLTWYFRAQNTDFSVKNIVFVNDKLDEDINSISFASINKEKRTMTYFQFAPEMKTDIGKHGEYKLSALQPLLHQEKYTHPEQLALWAYVFGAPIEQIVVSPDSHVTDASTARRALMSAAHNQQLGWLEVLGDVWLLSSTQEYQKASFEVASWEEWQRLHQRLVAQSSQPGCAVAVANATDQVGLAGTISQLLEKSGIEIIRLVTNDQQLAQTQLHINSAECLSVANLVKRVLPVSVEPTINPDVEQVYRSQVLIIVGEDVAEFSPQLSF